MDKEWAENDDEKARYVTRIVRLCLYFFEIEKRFFFSIKFSNKKKETSVVVYNDA